MEAHTGFLEHKRLIDAYRLSLYLKSTRIRPSKRPVHGIDDFSEAAMGLWLEQLETRGIVMQSNLENNRGYLIQTPSG